MPHSPTPATLVLKAPLSGVVVAIDQVPDPVFAQRMVGDGVSIDPVSQVLVAPCSGRVVQLHSAGHAVTLATDEGIEVMMHIGLDTVTLKGQGFSPKVAGGDLVAMGDPLIEFDADFVATHARSLLTQIVITNGDRVASLRPASGRVVAGRDPLVEIVLGAAAAAEPGIDGSQAVSPAIVIPTATGLHARPAAVVAAAAKRFKSSVRLRRGSTDANAKSVVAIMGLEVGQGETIRVVADGPDAQAAVEHLAALLREGLGDEGAAPARRRAEAGPEAPTRAAPEASARAAGPVDPDVFVGVGASPGVAFGHVVQVRPEEIAVPTEADDAVAERRRLGTALEQAKGQLDALQGRLRADADAGKAAIFAAHAELLDDPDLRDIAEHAIATGKSAAFAWRQAITTHADRLARSRNELLAARANDLRDVGRRVLRLLTGSNAEPSALPPNTILIAEDLTPSDTASLDRSRVLGFCTTGGGATSHVAILARSLDIPAVAAIDPRALDVATGTPVIIDGTHGTLRRHPSDDEVARVSGILQRRAARRAADLAAASELAVTRDGRRIEVVANVGGVADAAQVVGLGGEGIGLLRTEFLFMERASGPDEEEQTESYLAVVRALGRDRPVIIRTLDVGGDKPLPYLPMPAEENPFLGERGIRLMLDRPDLLRAQLRAILRASAEGRVLVMFPMIATLGEWRAARTMLEEERARLGAAPVPAGIMVEVPAAALMAGRFAREVDFFSIGTNDLTQYALAMDRGHPKLAAHVDGLNPAVLQLIAATVEAAHQHGKWVGVCGGIASDPQAVPLLVGLGVDELSVSVPALPAVKAQIRSLDSGQSRALAVQALALGSAADVRALVPEAD